MNYVLTLAQKKTMIVALLIKIIIFDNFSI